MSHDMQLMQHQDRPHVRCQGSQMSCAQHLACLVAQSLSPCTMWTGPPPPAAHEHSDDSHDTALESGVTTAGLSLNPDQQRFNTVERDCNLTGQQAQHCTCVCPAKAYCDAKAWSSSSVHSDNTLLPTSSDCVGTRRSQCRCSVCNQ